MTRSSNSEYAKRINAALELIKECTSMARAAAALAGRFSISRSQAYRYIHKAQSMGKEVPVPGLKVPFTVKLSLDLIQKLRLYASSTGKNLSEVVAQALETFLHGIHGRG